MQALRVEARGFLVITADFSSGDDHAAQLTHFENLLTEVCLYMHRTP